MQTQDFKLFLEVADAGSMTRVAAQRHTVQSHISRQIADLERRCGAPLFRRTGRGVALTEYGAQVAQRVRHWIHETEALLGELQASAREPMGEVRLAVLPSAVHPLITTVFGRLRQAYPHIRLNVREGQGGELDAMLDAGLVDMAILFRFAPPATRDEVPLSTADTYLVSAPGAAPTASPTIAFNDLEGLPLILPRRPAHWRAILDETARSGGFEFNCLAEADSLTLQKQLLLEHPDAFTLLGPFAFSHEWRQGRLQASKVVKPELKRYVTLARPKQGQSSKASQLVFEIIVATVAGWSGLLDDAPSHNSAGKPKPASGSATARVVKDRVPPRGVTPQPGRAEMREVLSAARQAGDPEQYR